MAKPGAKPSTERKCVVCGTRVVRSETPESHYKMGLCTEHGREANRARYAKCADVVNARRRKRYAEDLGYRAKCAEQNRKTRVSRSCEACGAAFLVNGRANAKWCDRCRDEEATAARRASQARYRKKTRRPRTCRVCGVDLRGTRRKCFCAECWGTESVRKAYCVEKAKRWDSRRTGVDLVYTVAKKTRALIRNSFARRGYTKRSRAHTLLGCSWDHLVAHLASLCYGGMTPEDILANDGRVHIDHITPLATAKTEEDVIRLCHYTNLQPLWAADNLEKSDRLDWVHPRDRA